MEIILKKSDIGVKENKEDFVSACNIALKDINLGQPIHATTAENIILYAINKMMPKVSAKKSDFEWLRMATNPKDQSGRVAMTHVYYDREFGATIGCDSHRMHWVDCCIIPEVAGDAITWNGKTSDDENLNHVNMRQLFDPKDQTEVEIEFKQTCSLTMNEYVIKKDGETCPLFLNSKYHKEGIMKMKNPRYTTRTFEAGKSFHHQIIVVTEGEYGCLLMPIVPPDAY